MWFLVPLAAVVALILGGVIGAAARGATPAVVTTQTVTTSTTVTMPPPPSVGGPASGEPGEPKYYGDGIWKLDSQIPAGIYITEVPAGATCYYALLRSKSESDVESNAILKAGTVAAVALTARNGSYFQTKNCGTWSRQG